MAHPYHAHREHQVEHRRIHKVLEEAPAEHKKHSHGNAFSKVNSKSAAMAHDEMACGGTASPKRYARGGKVDGFAKGGHVKGKKGGHQTNIAIVMPHHPAGGMAPPPGGAPGGMPPGGPPPMPPPGAGGPPGGPPGMPPPGGMPGMPRARGGRANHIGGEATKGNIEKWSARASANSYASGGRLPTAGSFSGVARKQMTHIEKAKKK
jgi:hypothetical protein